MAPIVIEEDTNICTAAIITLDDDSEPSEDGETSTWPMQSQSPPPPAFEQEQEEATDLHIGESDHVPFVQHDLASLDDDYSDNGSGSNSGDILGDDDEANLSDETVLYIDEEEEVVMEVHEIHIGSDSSEEVSEAEIEALETMEMIDTLTEELLIDLNEVTQTTFRSLSIYNGTRTSLLTSPVRQGWAGLSFDNDLHPGEASNIDEFRDKAPLTLQKELEDEASESNILDSPVMKDFAGWDTSNDLQPEPTSKVKEIRGKAPVTLQQEFQDVSEDLASPDVDEDGYESDISFRSCDSDDEDETLEAGNKTLWKELKHSNWIAGDLSTILDPVVDEKILMPTDFQGRKRVLMQLFLLLSRVVFFIDLSVRRERIFKLIPEKFWLLHYTWTDTRQVFEARDKELCINLLTRTKTVLEEWRLSSNFQRLPETQDDLKDAARLWRRKVRERRIKELLSSKSCKSDRWLTHIFLDVIDCLPWQDVLEADSEIRKAVIKKVLAMAELCFEQIISVTDEFQDVKARRESMRTIVQNQLNIVLEKTHRLTLVD